MDTTAGASAPPLPIIIIGAGISGLLLAQQLRKSNIPFEIFERDTGFTTRGVGWGVTLHWSLPALRSCLPDDLMARFPSTYVDRAAIERGESTAFPFFELSTGEKTHSGPKLDETKRIRVSRQRLRSLLAEGIDVQWGKRFREFEEDDEGVSVAFEDGTMKRGALLVGCDGSHSRVRRKVFPDWGQYENHPIPVRLWGFTMGKSGEEAMVMRDLDPFVVHGTSIMDNSFMFLSLLSGPGESEGHADYVYSVCISRRLREDEKADEHGRVSSTADSRFEAVEEIVKGWSDPFRTFILSSLPDTDIKQMDLDDFVPPSASIPATSEPATARIVLLGDALHTMTMYRGEGANHAIVDVLDFKEKIIPYLDAGKARLDKAVVRLQQAIIERTIPAVLASRQACLDAHDWVTLMAGQLPSPLLTKREMRLQFP